MGDMYIYPSEGSAYIVTVFNMVVFRPFADEVLSGSIHSISETGMKVSVGFFDEIFVPAHRLPSPHEYESGETEDGEAGAEAACRSRRQGRPRGHGSRRRGTCESARRGLS